MKTPLLAAALLLISVRAQALPATIEVTDADNEPVAGASVQFESFGEPRGTSLQTTDATGHAVFEVQPSLTYARFLGRIVVYKAGFALAGGNLNLSKGVADSATLNIALPRPTSSSGTVTDAAGAPIEGALVTYQLTGIKTGEKISRDGVPILYDGPLLKYAQTRTDAAGQWSFDLLPPGGVAMISAVARGTQTARVSAQAGENAPIQLVPGAIVTGKIIGLKGEPLEGIRVVAQGSDTPSNEMWSDATTGADGTYELLGLGSGEFNIIFYGEREMPYVLAAHAKVRTRVGETLDLGETRAQAGFEIGGTVRDAAGQPVGGAEIGVYGPRNPASSAAVANATSDAQGRWKLRTLAGENKIYLMGAPTGFVRDSQERNEKLDGPRDDFDFVLQRTTPISGHVVDEAGKPVKIALYGIVEGGENFVLNADENGEFTAQAPTKGTFEVTTDQPYGAPSDWEIVGPRSVGAPGENVKIVVKPRVFETWTVSVATPDGQPVAGAQVKYNYQGKNYIEQTFVSDAKGALQIRKPQGGQQINFGNASKSGFDYLSGGELVNGAPTDITFGARDGALNGHIVNAQGVPVKGATVWAWKAETRSGPDGTYALKDLAQGATGAIALGAGGFGRGRGEITLVPQKLQAQDKARARQIAAELDALNLPDLAGRRPMILAPTTQAAWEALEPQTSKAEEGDSQRQTWLEAAFEIADVSSERLLLEARQIQNPVVHLNFAGELWRARHDSPDFDDEPFRAELPALQPLAGAVAAGDDVWFGLRVLLGYAALQQGLGDQTAALQTFDVATKRLWRAGDQPGDESVVTPDSILGQNSDAVGDSTVLLDRIGVLVDRESEGRYYYLQTRAGIAATAGGLAAAKPYLDELRALLDGPQPAGVRVSRPWFYAETVSKLVAKYGKAAPDVALELARSIPAETNTGDNKRAEAIVQAALFLPIEQARPLWHDNIESIAPTSRALSYVSQIKSRDAALARTFYRALKDRMDQANANADQDGANSWRNTDADNVTFAFYEADFDPASARFRLEKQWSNPQTRTREAVRAMAKLDATRALEWAAQLPANRYNSNPDFWAKRDVARWLDADENERQKLGADEISSY